jgi:PKD repeat protein
MVCHGEEVAFDASRSKDLDGQLVSYSWDFGDGAIADGPRVTHTYDSAGRYQVRLTITDDSGAACGTVTDTVAIVVNNQPVAVASRESSVFSGGAHDAVLFDGTGSYDPDGDALTYTWDFGDGKSESGSKVFHAYGRPGTYKVRLSVQDQSGLSCGQGSDEFTIEVRDRVAPEDTNDENPKGQKPEGD